MELEKSKQKRQNYLTTAWVYFIIFVICIPFVSIISFIILPIDFYRGKVLGYIFGGMIVTFIPSLCTFGGFLMYCYGRSKTQTMHLFENMAVYSYYSGSLDNREVFTFYIEKLKEYKVTRRNIKLKGQFRKQIVDRFGIHDRLSWRINIPRTFEREEELLAFFNINN